MKNNIMLYHGSNVIVDRPQWNLGSERRDFGQCFYTTYHQKMAKDWAVKKSNLSPVVNKYIIDLSRVHFSGQLNIKRFEANEEWAEFVYNNRDNERFKRPDYDIIIGPLADNKIKLQFSEMKAKGLSFAEVASKIKYRKYKTLQIAFCSEKALQMLKFLPR